MSKYLTEEAYTEGLGDMVKNGIANASDRVQWAFKNHKARGRLDLRAATRHLFKDWQAYMGRKQASGNPAGPNLSTLANFLKFQYGIEIGMDELERIAGIGAEQDSDEEKPTAEFRSQQALDQLKATSKGEYDALRNKMQGANANESVIVEATPAEVTFDPKVLFPRLADLLIDHGLMAISRNGEVTASARGAVGADDKSTPENPDAVAADPEDTTAKITADGHAIDAKKMSKLLTDSNISKDEMDEVKRILASGEAALLARLRRNTKVGKKPLAEVVAAIVNATLNSINDKNDPTAKIGNNITASGNTISIVKMKELLEQDGVTGTMMNAVRQEIAAGGEDALNKALQARGKTAKTIISITNAVLGATVNVGEKKAAPAAAKA